MRSALLAAVVAAVIACPSLRAQVVERPVPFDSAGRVMTISLALATRLHLGPPEWPVSGDYVEVRLFDRGNGAYVLVVERANRVVERYELSSDARAALQREVTKAMQSSGGLTMGERQDIISQPAGGQFVRNQTFAAFVFYGLPVAALTSEGAARSGLYLATVGATFFASAQIAKNRVVTRAQNHMASDGIWRGAVIGNALLYAAGGDDSGDAFAAATLGGSLAGTIIGFTAGRTLTDGEAGGATLGSTTLGMAAAGVIGMAGGFQHDERRAEVAGIVGGMALGFPLGLRYVRQAPYAVTSGDAAVLAMARNIGILGAATAVVEGDPSGQTIAAVLTAGLVGGTLLGDRWFVRHYDYTESEGALVALGGVAGGLITIALPLAMDANGGQIYTGLGSLGALAGMVLTTEIVQARRISGGGTDRGRAAALQRRKPVLAFHPENALMLAKPQRALTVVPLVSVRF